MLFRSDRHPQGMLALGPLNLVTTRGSVEGCRPSISLDGAIENSDVNLRSLSRNIEKKLRPFSTSRNEGPKFR